MGVKVLYSREVRKLHVLENNDLRIILALKTNKVIGQFRTLHDEKILGLHRSLSVV
jgi:hypothetical protein